MVFISSMVHSEVRLIRRIKYKNYSSVIEELKNRKKTQR